MKKQLIILLMLLVLMAVSTSALTEVYDSLANESDSDGVAEDDTSLFGLAYTTYYYNVSFRQAIRSPPNATISVIGINVTDAVATNNIRGNITICRTTAITNLGTWFQNCDEQTIVKQQFNYSLYINVTADDQFAQIPITPYAMNSSWDYVIYVNTFADQKSSTGDYLVPCDVSPTNTLLQRLVNATKDNPSTSSYSYLAHLKLYADTTPLVEYNLSLMLTDLWDSSYITNFSTTIGGVTKGTTNGLIQYNLTNGTYSVTYNNVGNSTFYAMGGINFACTFPCTINYAVAGATNKTNVSAQNHIYVSTKTKVTNASISAYNSTLNTSLGKAYNYSYSTVGHYYPHTGAVQLWGNKSGFYPSDNISFTASKSSYSKTLEFPFSRLNISAKDAVSGTYLNTFTAVLNTSGYGQTFAVTTGHAYAYIGNGTYTLTVTAATYSTAVSVVTVNATMQNTTALLYQSGSANINVYDEETGNLLLKNVSISFISTGYAQNYSTGNGTLYMPNLTSGDYTILYSSSGYGTRRYYTSLNGTTAINANLYLLNSSISSNILARVSDQNGDYMEEVTVQLLRYYLTSNSYKTVAMIKTDSLGYGSLDVKLNDPTYQFLLQYEGETVYSTIGSPIWNTNTQEFQINTIEDFLYSLKNIDNVYTNLYYDNITGEFVYTFADNQGLLRSGCLKVISRGTTGDTIICDNCENSTAATITCTADTPKTLYIATAYVDTNTNYSIHIRDVLSRFTSFTTPIYATQGVFYSFMIIAVMAMLGIWNPVVSILLGLMGLLLSVWLEFISFGAATYTIVVGLIIVGLIAMLKIEG